MRTKEQAVAAYNYLTTGEVADALSCSRSHVIALIQKGAIKAIDVGVGSRKEYRVSPDALNDFVEQRRIA